MESSSDLREAGRSSAVKLVNLFDDFLKDTVNLNQTASICWMIASRH
jgi:hypothetical protein